MCPGWKWGRIVYQQIQLYQRLVTQDFTLAVKGLLGNQRMIALLSLRKRLDPCGLSPQRRLMTLLPFFASKRFTIV